MESPSGVDVLAEDAGGEIAVRWIENQSSAWIGLRQARAGFVSRRQTDWGELKVGIDENLKLRGKEGRLRGRTPVFI
jgi:hypothetical protein